MSTTAEQILQTAAQLWHERSYTGVGVAEICKEAQVNKGSFFHFYDSKETLLLAVLDHHEAAMLAFLAQSFTADRPPLERFDHHIETVAAMAKQDAQSGSGMCGCPIGNIASELSTATPAVKEKVQSIFDSIRAVFRKALRDGVAAGDIPKGTDLTATAAAILAYTQGIALMSKTYDNMRMLKAAFLQMRLLIPRTATA